MPGATSDRSCPRQGDDIRLQRTVAFLGWLVAVGTGTHANDAQRTALAHSMTDHVAQQFASGRCAHHFSRGLFPHLGLHAWLQPAAAKLAAPEVIAGLGETVPSAQLGDRRPTAASRTKPMIFPSVNRFFDVQYPVLWDWTQESAASYKREDVV